MAGYDAKTIAKWFVAWAEADEADLSNLKLQKLLYYAQGHHLARYSEPLFEDKIEAWSHGPVVPPVYRSYKKFHSGDIRLAESDAFEFTDVDRDTTQFLINVWDAYGKFGAWNLRNMTHSEPPWADSFEQDVSNIEISQDAIRQHFASRA